jgi:hypothetical protein
MGQFLGRLEHLSNGGGQLLPFALFRFQLLAAAFGEFIEFRAAVVLGCAPAGFDPASPLEAMQRRIQRTLLDLENFAGNLMDPLGNSPAVIGSQGQRSQDQQIERALRKIDALLRHMLPLRFYREVTLFLVEVQGEGSWIVCRAPTQGCAGESWDSGGLETLDGSQEPVLPRRVYGGKGFLPREAD